jgi:hypothetical protein
MGHEDCHDSDGLASTAPRRRSRDPGDAMSWQDLTGRRIRVGGELGRVVHVDSFRVILMTEPGDGVPPHRVVVPQDDLVDVEELDEQGED